MGVLASEPCLVGQEAQPWTFDMDNTTRGTLFNADGEACSALGDDNDGTYDPALHDAEKAKSYYAAACEAGQSDACKASASKPPKRPPPPPPAPRGGPPKGPPKAPPPPKPPGKP
jgi:hypothetical protein